MLCASASSAEQPVVDGRFTLRFTEDVPHKVCALAPCPTGTYTLEVDGREIAHAPFVEVAPQTAEADRRILEAFLRQSIAKTLVVEGAAFLRARPRIVIWARRLANGSRR